MSDYISKSALIKAMEKVKSEIQTPADTVWNNAVKVCIDNVIEAPTISETEIIRKAFERVFRRMKAISYREEPNDCDPFGDVPHYVVSLPAINQILKEECGISE